MPAFTPRAAVRLFGGLFLALGSINGCGGGDAIGPDDPTGSIQVAVSTGGADPDPDGYLATLDGTGPALPLPVTGSASFPDIAVGDHTVALSGLRSNCNVDAASKSVTVTKGATAPVSFTVSCSAAPTVGSIQVSVVTTGEELDPDGYRVAVDGGESQSLLISGSLGISGFTPGEHDVALSDVADNCVVAGNNPVRVAVLGGTTAAADFTVSCSPVPVAAPDHDIAFESDGEVYLLGADGTTLTNLTDNPSHDADPAWSPDGETIAFESARTGIRQIYVMNADGSGQTQLTRGASANSPAWSPDGSRIAFMSIDAGNQQIYLMNPDGSGIAQLTNTADGDVPAWSPDGTKIAFTGVDGTNFDIFVMNADGSNVTRLTTTLGVDAAPHWSPDGTKIAFHSDRSGDRHIHVMNSDGTGVTQLTFGSSSDIQPEWSPDGSKITFASVRTGASRLYMMNPDGTAQVPLTPTSYEASSPAWRP